MGAHRYAWTLIGALDGYLRCCCLVGYMIYCYVGGTDVVELTLFDLIYRWMFRGCPCPTTPTLPTFLHPFALAPAYTRFLVGGAQPLHLPLTDDSGGWCSGWFCCLPRPHARPTPAPRAPCPIPSAPAPCRLYLAPLLPAGILRLIPALPPCPSMPVPCVYWPYYPTYHLPT